MAKELNTRIQLKHGLAAKWTERNPVLLAGEVGIETDTLKMKVGDGTSHWDALGYLGADANDILAIINENRDSCTTVNVVEGQSDTEALATISNPKNGDIAVLEKSISGGKKSHTAYVYDNAWKAMDGNYNASNVYFDKDLTYTVAIGTLAQPSGSGTFSAAGKNVEQVLSSLMAKEANPSKSNPAVSFSVEEGFGTFEIGTKKNLTYTAALSAGSYTYGPATGITAQTWEVSCTGVTGTKSTANGTFENVVAEATAKKITATATYNEGAIPVTNLGNPYPAGKIAAGTASKDSDTLTGVRHMFYGVVKSADFTLDSAHIRSLNHEAANKKTISTFTAGDKALKVVVACPAGYNVTKVTLPSAMGADATADFVKQSGTVQVEGAEGYTAAAYSVWVFEPATIPSSQSYSIVIG